MTSSSCSPGREDSPANPYRALPSVSRVIAELEAPHLAPDLLAQVVRDEMDRIRSQIEAGDQPTTDQVLDRCRDAVAALAMTRLTEVINGTGIVLHTNLGRAPVSEDAALAMSSAAGSYLSLEIDPETGLRGGRMEEIQRLLGMLTGAEAALVVNNNASAVLLTLAGLCAGREVIVSRGEAVEIGGGFRIPDVVDQSGCRLIEVGTTNRTYVSDYLEALSDATGALLRVHPSNFRISGFVASPATAELAALATEQGILLIEDLGSGALIDTTRFGIRSEPTVSDALLAGAAIVTFSGDKLLGGPQAGFICGRAPLIRMIERHPLARAVRTDKTTLAGVTATLRHYLAGEAEARIPIWQMIATDTALLQQRAQQIVASSRGIVVSSTASIGGGSLPGETLQSAAILLESSDPDTLARHLRLGNPRVFPIIRDGAVMIDMRTVLPRQDRSLARAISDASV